MANADSFQKFDSTIVKVLGQIALTHIQVAAGISSKDLQVYLYLYVADKSLPLANMPDLSDGSVQAAYLWTQMSSGRIVRTTEAGGDQADDTLNRMLTLDVNAQRRFRENNNTLWFKIHNKGNQSLLWGSYIRTLVRIP